MKNIKKSFLLLLAMLLIFVVACNNTRTEDPNDMQDGGNGNVSDNDNGNVSDSGNGNVNDNPEDPHTPEDPTAPGGSSTPGNPATPDTPANPDTPDGPVAQTWREKVTDSGYKGAKLIRKVGDKTTQQTFGKTFADEINYIAGLTDSKQSNGPSSYTDYSSFSIAFDDPSGNNYGIDFIYVKKNGTTYLAVKEDKENTRWLTADAVTYFEEVLKDNNITL